MSTVTAARPPLATNDAALQARFLALLPRLELHGRICFRHIRCPASRADKIGEMIALAWRWFVRLHQRGKDLSQFAMVFIGLVGRAVKSGRRLCGQERANDVLSPLAQQRHGFHVTSLPAPRCSHDALYSSVHGQQQQDLFEERLRDNTHTPPPDAAAFRIDFPRFLASLSDRDRQLATFLSLGHRATRAARRFHVTPARVTQLRQRWCAAWRRFEDGAAAC